MTELTIKDKRRIPIINKNLETKVKLSTEKGFESGSVAIKRRKN